MKVRLASYAEHQTTEFEIEQSAADFVYDRWMQQKYF